MTGKVYSDELTELETQFSEYLDDAMTATQRRAFETILKTSPAIRAEFEQFRGAMQTIAKLDKVTAPEQFDRNVTRAIHRRSAGRFFGRKAFGDRVPFELLAVVALVLMLGLFWWLRWSATGSVTMPSCSGADSMPPNTDSEAQQVLPRP